MKPIYFPFACTGIAALILFSGSRADAALIAADSFLTTGTGTGGTYSTGTATSRIYGQEPTVGNSGFTGAWTTSPVLTTADLQVETGGLSHSLVPNPASTNDGNALGSNGGSDRTVVRELSTFSLTESSYYMSALLRAGSVPSATGLAVIGLSGIQTTTALVTNGVQVGIDDGKIQLFYNNTSGTRTSEIIYSAAANTTYQFVLRLDLDVNGMNQDRFTVDIYGTGSTVSLANVSVLGSQETAAASFGYMVLSKGNLSGYSSLANTPRFDEFRFGTELADVSLVPEPGSMALLALGSLGLMVRRRRA